MGVNDDEDMEWNDAIGDSLDAEDEGDVVVSHKRAHDATSCNDASCSKRSRDDDDDDDDDDAVSSTEDLASVEEEVASQMHRREDDVYLLRISEIRTRRCVNLLPRATADCGTM